MARKAKKAAKITQLTNQELLDKLCVDLEKEFEAIIKDQEKYSKDQVKQAKKQTVLSEIKNKLDKAIYFRTSSQHWHEARSTALFVVHQYINRLNDEHEQELREKSEK